MTNAEISKAFTAKGVNKQERYKWSVKDEPGRYKKIEKHKLQVDYSYQRDTKAEKIKAIRSSWSYVACGAISVSERDDGSYYVIDGQHRVLAAMARSDISHLDCMVFQLNSSREEAIGFLAAQVQRKPVTASEKFKAEIVAGDKDAIFIANLLNSSGYKISDSQHGGKVRCIGALLSCVRADREVMARAWPAVVAAASGKSVDSRVVKAFFWLEKNADGNSLSDPFWIKRVSQVGQDQFVSAAIKAGAYYSGGGGSVWGPAMQMEMNKRIRTNFKTKNEQ